MLRGGEVGHGVVVVLVVLLGFGVVFVFLLLVVVGVVLGSAGDIGVCPVGAERDGAGEVGDGDVELVEGAGNDGVAVPRVGVGGLGTRGGGVVVEGIGQFLLTEVGLGAQHVG